MDVYVPVAHHAAPVPRPRPADPARHRAGRRGRRTSGPTTTTRDTETEEQRAGADQPEPARPDHRAGGRHRGTCRRRGRRVAPACCAAAQHGRRLRDHGARAAAQAGAAHQDDLQHRARRDRVDLADRRRHRDHEHHARVDPGAHPRDRRAARGGRDPAGHPLPVPERGRADQRRRRRRRESSSAPVSASASSGSPASSTIVSYLSVFVAFGVSFAVGLVFGIVPA